ncbi:MAG: ribonuclease PH [Planctomycetes bacterium]|nr:ribonuclease PH [Planctomycetota bacterium]
MTRRNGRTPEQIRPLRFTRAYTPHAPGSVLAEAGDTRVLCTVTFTDQVPQWLQGQGSAWLTAEYGMLPGSTHARKARDSRTGKIDARSLEIQRLIGRSLRAILDLRALPEMSIWVDCDVISADGGTRTTAVNGAAVALHDAIQRLTEKRSLRRWPLSGLVSAVSVGMVQGKVVADLDYGEDSQADVDMNVVCLSDGRFVEVQGSAERAAFDDAGMQELLRVARAGCKEVHERQRAALGL